MAGKIPPKQTKKPATKKPVKKTPPKPKAQKPATPKAKPQEDKPAKATTEPKERSGFGGFLDSVQGAFSSAGAGLGQLHSSTKPLEFSPEEKKEGLKAADTMDKLAGTDGKWDRNDLANNLAQLPESKRFNIKESVIRSKLFEQHGVPREEQAGILEQSREIRKENPEIDQLRGVQRKYGSRVDDMKPEQREKYEAYVDKHTAALKEKGLLPIEYNDIQEMGGASTVLQEKLAEAGLPKPKPGAPVDAGQYRGLFEGKSPLATQVGF